jgi:hypothetical protein
MAGEITSNTVAAAIVSKFLEDPNMGAIKLSGFLYAGPTAAEDPDFQASPDDSLRLYTDDTFRRFITVKRKDILYHLPGGADPMYPTGAIWVDPETIVKKSEHGPAYKYSMLDHDDVAEGPHGPHYP